MATLDSYALAARCKFLKDLSLAAREDFLNAGRFREFASGEFLFHQDKPATTFYILLHGRVRLAQLTPEGSQVTVHYATPAKGSASSSRWARRATSSQPKCWKAAPSSARRPS